MLYQPLGAARLVPLSNERSRTVSLADRHRARNADRRCLNMGLALAVLPLDVDLLRLLDTTGRRWRREDNLKILQR